MVGPRCETAVQRRRATLDCDALFVVHDAIPEGVRHSVPPIFGDHESYDLALRVCRRLAALKDEHARDVRSAAVAHVVRVLRFYVLTELDAARSRLERDLASAASVKEAVAAHRSYLVESVSRAAFSSQFANVHGDVLAVLDTAGAFFADPSNQQHFGTFAATVTLLRSRLAQFVTRGRPSDLAALRHLLDWDDKFFSRHSSRLLL